MDVALQEVRLCAARPDNRQSRPSGPLGSPSIRPTRRGRGHCAVHGHKVSCGSTLCLAPCCIETHKGWLTSASQPLNPPSASLSCCRQLGRLHRLHPLFLCHDPSIHELPGHRGFGGQRGHRTVGFVQLWLRFQAQQGDAQVYEARCARRQGGQQVLYAPQWAYFGRIGRMGEREASS